MVRAQLGKQPLQGTGVRKGSFHEVGSCREEGNSH